MKAFAKINLYLDIGPIRRDGFHDIATIFQTVALADELRISLLNEEKIVFETDSGLIWDESNIMFRAVAEITRFTGKKTGMKIELKKNIPAGGGLGGGSSDAAVLLAYLGSILGIRRDTIFAIARSLGSDVPFFLRSGTAIAFGKGDRLFFPGDLEDFSVSVAFPRSRVSTIWAYNRIDEISRSCNLDWKRVFTFYRILSERANIPGESSVNSFEKPVFDSFEDIWTAFRELTGDSRAVFTRMSGSGSTVYNLFYGPIGELAFVSSKEVKKTNDF